MRILATPSELAAAFASAGLVPALSPPDGASFLFSPEHRATASSEIVYLFNESRDDRAQTLRVNLDARRIRMFDPATGMVNLDAAIKRGGTIDVRLQAKRSALLVLDR